MKVRYGVQDVVAAVKSGIGNTDTEPEGPARSTVHPPSETIVRPAALRNLRW